MLRRSDRNLENIPVGALGLIPLKLYHAEDHRR